MPDFQNPDGSAFMQSGGQPITVVAPASGATVAMKMTQRRLYIANSATLAALTVLLPKKVPGGNNIEIACQSAITALTIHDGFGNAITGAPTAGAAGAAIVMTYVNKAVGWVKWK